MLRYIFKLLSVVVVEILKNHFVTAAATMAAELTIALRENAFSCPLTSASPDKCDPYFTVLLKLFLWLENVSARSFQTITINALEVIG